MTIYATHNPNTYFEYRGVTYRVCTYWTIDGRWAGFVEDWGRINIAPADTRRAAILAGLRTVLTEGSNRQRQETNA